MICAEDRAALLSEFTYQVQRHLSPGVWRSLFEERTGRAQFGTATRTVLCIECPNAGPVSRQGLTAAMTRLSTLHGGCIDPCADAFAFVSFKEPEQAVQLAVALQRACARLGLRMGMLTGPCKLVRCHVDSSEILMLLGSARERAVALAQRSAPGTVQVAPETYEAMNGVFSDELGSCVVMAEFEDGVVSEVTLALPPDETADVSTFAGLGLS